MGTVTPLETMVATALNEDAADHDITSAATIPEGQTGKACILAKAPGILSGITVAEMVFTQLDSSTRVHWRCHDADAVQPGDVICTVSGRLRAVLAAERTALNFLQRLSGIATLTHAFCQAVHGTGCRIVDTRKTTPGLRHLEKQAVTHGGGDNHRMDLESGMLIKENHIMAAGSIAQAVERCRRQQEYSWIEIECESLAQVREAVTCKPDLILLDNMSTGDVTQARALVPGDILLEASGGITLANARDYAETGVDRLAIGAITHSASALDISMRVT